jgi:hypothetical protein
MYEVEAGRKAQMDPIEVPVLRPAANGNAIPARVQGLSDQAATSSATPANLMWMTRV